MQSIAPFHLEAMYKLANLRMPIWLPRSLK